MYLIYCINQLYSSIKQQPTQYTIHDIEHNVPCLYFILLTLIHIYTYYWPTHNFKIHQFLYFYNLVFCTFNTFTLFLFCFLLFYFLLFYFLYFYTLYIWFLYQLLTIFILLYTIIPILLYTNYKFSGPELVLSLFSQQRCFWSMKL